MKLPLLAPVALLIAFAPAEAHGVRHHHGHVVGTHARHGEAGFPITAAKDSIRINAVGEVISQPVPVIEKERNFDARSRHELSTPQPQVPPVPAPSQP